MKRSAFGFWSASALSMAMLGACSSSSSSETSTPPDAGADAIAEASPDTSVAPYPAGPYGVATGNVFPNVTWQGERGGKAPVVTISSAEYYDPSGSKGIRGVLFTVTAVGCGGPAGPCNQGARATEAASAGLPYDFEKRGGREVDILTQNWTQQIRPTTTADIDTWVSTNGITHDAVIDPMSGDAGTNMVSIGTFDAVPTELVVDPRTMKVKDVIVGYGDQSLMAFDTLLVKNGAPPATIPDAGTD